MPFDALIVIEGVPGESDDASAMMRHFGPLPISDFTTFSGGSLQRCTFPVHGFCDSIAFRTTSVPTYDGIDVNFFDFSGTPKTLQILFAEGSFDAIGSYTSIDGSATLNIAPVPEVGTWLMLIIGFGLVGTALRRRAAGFGRPRLKA